MIQKIKNKFKSMGKSLCSSQRMKTMALMLAVGTTAAFAQNAAGDYSAGTTALGTVTTEIAKYIPYVVKLCYAIAGIVAVGAMLKAAELGMVILIDGFIMTNCILAASRLYPEVMSYAIFGHQGDESGHKLLLDYLGARPLLNLGLRLGEGSGSVCAYPIVDSAVKMLNEMDSFAHASITKYF